MIVFDLLWIIYCIAEGYEDAWYVNTNHWRAALRRIATGLVLVYALCGVSGAWVLYANTGLALGSIFLVVFNIARNIAHDDAWNYIGATSSWDRRLRKLPNKLVWSAFFLLMALSVTVQFFHSTYIVKAEPLINTTWLF